MWIDSIRSMIDSTVGMLREYDLYPTSHVVSGPTTEPEIIVDGRKVLQFCTANYLGLATYPELRESVKIALNEYGLAASASRLVCGTQDPHLELEESLAQFENTEDAVVFFAVTLANFGSIVSVMNPPLASLFRSLGFNNASIKGKKAIFVDHYSHPTVMDACKLAEVDRIYFYRHCDMDHLEGKLRKSDAEIKMIATDGLFSADGDFAPLPDIVELAEEYEALVFVDDAHATGVIGENGRGTWEYYAVEDRVDIKVGSLSKALASGLGGFVVGDKDFTDYIRVTARHYIFGGSIPPAVAKGITTAIKLATTETWRRKTVLANAQYFRERLNALGFDTLKSQAQIVPILIGDDQSAILVAEELYKQGIFTPCFRWPAVPHGRARIRVNLMATHTKEHLERFLETFEKVAEKYRVREALSAMS